MALYPRNFTNKEIMSPGYDGSRFQANLPGYRDHSDDRINRTNTQINVSEHDVPNIKYAFDFRLPVLFRYGFGVGYNQIVIPKGRVVAVDPRMDLVDTESEKKFSTLTLANGGASVRLRKAGDKFKTAANAKSLVSPVASGKDVPEVSIGRDWTPLKGLSDTYEETCFRPTKEKKDAIGQLADYTDEVVEMQEGTGLVRVKTTGVVPKVGEIRLGNVPIGIIERNEYTRDDDAFNGIMPGPVRTDALVELPWFAYKDKAEQNPWGSAYGQLFPGCLVRSDENGRIVPSILNFNDLMAGMDIQEYELERQQVLGTVYAVNTDLVPEGAAKWATWALEDRMNSEYFNPSVYRKTNRRGEDAVENSPYNSTNTYPGYPYDKNYLNHDLHMLASDRIDLYDPRMNPEFRYNDLGIPGLTDGANVFTKVVADQVVGHLGASADLSQAHDGSAMQEYNDVIVRLPDVNIKEGTILLDIGETPIAIPADDTAWAADAKLCKVGQVVGTNFVVKYVNAAQGIITIGAKDQENATLKAIADAVKANKKPLSVRVVYQVKGKSGVPTFMDWDGVVGSVKILLQK